MNFDIFEILLSCHQRQRLAHALLLQIDNESRVIQRQGILSFIQSLMCLDPDSSHHACGRCASCQLFAAQEAIHHTDFIQLEAENTLGYTVDQIRELGKFLSLKSNISPRRVVFLKDAEKLSLNRGIAANALLKLLEEPRPNTFLVLDSTQPLGVLHTIRSRCQFFRLPKPEGELIDLRESELDAWTDLLQWIQKGAPKEASFSSPADDENFWKDRKASLEELKQIFQVLWRINKSKITQLPPNGQQSVLDFFVYFDEFISKMHSYASGPLQWKNFLNLVKMDLLWK